MKKGMAVYVLRNSDGRDCTNDGITSRYERLILVGKGVPKLVEAKSDEEVVELEVTSTGYMRCRPIVEPKDGTYYCAGGNFIYTSDSRFPCHYPLSVHDRQDNY